MMIFEPVFPTASEFCLFFSIIQNEEVFKGFAVINVPKYLYSVAQNLMESSVKSTYL